VSAVEPPEGPARRAVLRAAIGIGLYAAAFGASFGFVLPVSTPPNAIVYGSGMVPITKMIRSGIVFDVIGAMVIVIGVIVMAQVVGLA